MVQFSDEQIAIDDTRYISDLVAEFKLARERNRGEYVQCRLLFKKKMFREGDEAITEPIFVQLSYVQVNS